MNLRLRAKIEHLKLRVLNKNKFEQGLVFFNNKDVELVIKEYKKERSYNQNAYYWGVVVKLISEHTGDDRQAIHEYLKSKFGLRKLVKLNNGEVFESVVSTTRYNTKQFEEYLEKIRGWCSIIPLYIPLPNEIEIPENYFTI